MKKKAKLKAELQLPELQAIILRTARHLPCFMSPSLSLVPMLPLLVCDRASCIAHTIVVAKDVDQHHTTATFRHALFAGEGFAAWWAAVQALPSYASTKMG